MTNDAITESCLSFTIGHDLFAAGSSYIHDVLEVGAITAMPHAPAFIRGVMNLRGAALPVVDSRMMFGMPVTMVTEDTSILVLDLAAGEKRLRVGVMVDAVNEVLQVETDDIMPLPSSGAPYPLDFIRGTAKWGDAFVYLLDIVHVFTTEELMRFQATVVEVPVWQV